MTTAAKIDQSTSTHGHQPASGDAARANGERGGPKAAVVPLSLREVDSAALRPKVAAMESELARLRDQRDVQGYADALKHLTVSWNALVECMALGEATEMRACPHCHYQIRLRATRCIQCWKTWEVGA